MKKSIIKIVDYLTLIKFSHTLFALPFALVGYALALHFTNSTINLKLLVLVILCMVFARNAAMAFNRYIDRDFDKINPRTSLREIPSGIITPESTLIFVIINVILFITATYFINKLCFYLSPIALLIILGYSYTKRFTSFCHLILGVGLSLAPIGSYIAVTGEFAILPLFYSFAVLFWVSGFDIIYALQDSEFDRSQQLKSLPVLLGVKNALRFSSLLHVFTGLLLIIAGYYAGFKLFYWIGTLIFIFMLVYQHKMVKPHDLSKVNLAFFTTNGIASVIFAVFFLMEIWN